MGRIQGRGFGIENSVQIYAGAQALPIHTRTRDFIDFIGSTGGTQLKVIVNGTLIQTMSTPSVGTVSYLVSEVSTQGATTTGGFYELYTEDAQRVQATRRNNGTILIQASFRKLTQAANMKLVLRRQYIGTTVGTETVQLYDWSSASYPYGNFVTVGTTPCPTLMTTSTFGISNFQRFIDPEGTVYMLITTSDNLPEGAELRLDHTRLDVQ
jgi:hypothetical protein